MPGRRVRRLPAGATRAGPRAGAVARAAAAFGMSMLVAHGPALAGGELRPQLDDAAAARLTMADYLGDWRPAPLGDPSAWTPDLVVAADGSGTHRTVQAAIDALPARGQGATQRTRILVTPGVYREPLCIQDKAPFVLYGRGDPAEVVIVEGRYNALPKAREAEAHRCLPLIGADTHGTPGSASVMLFSDDAQLLRLTIANDAMDAVRDGQGYPAGVGESGGAQAVALMTRGDRVLLDQVRLLGHQDTFFAERTAIEREARVLVRRSDIRGDVDFIFGAATLVIDDSLIVSRAGRRTPGHGGHVLAPSTADQRAHGFLVQRSRWLAEPGVAPASISLGRAWDRGIAHGTWRRLPEVSNGQALVRDNLLGPHLTGWSASTSRRPFSAQGPQANRLAEHRNTALPAGAFDVLPDGAGWASTAGGTRGGAHALPEHVRWVRSRAELDEALALGETSKLIAVGARIDLAVESKVASDETGVIGSTGATGATARRLTADDFRDPDFDWAAYQRAYDPERWGRAAPSGPLEDARRRSAERQARQVTVRVPPNTTLVGVTPDAGFDGGMLLLEKTRQVIVRHLRFSDAYDHFPAWDPKDNGHGEWNSEYDTLSLRWAEHVWIDHCSFDDGERPDDREPVVFGRRMQRHDGLLDITRRSDLVTVSWNVFRHHDKTMLIGGSDKHVDDRGALRVTLHHNLWEDVKERTPRVRFGQVHVLNNVFIGNATGPHAFQYAIGLGLEARVLSEGNVWQMPADVDPARVIRALGGPAHEDRGSLFNGAPMAPRRAADAHRWRPPYGLAVEPAEGLVSRVREGAGAGRLW